MKIAVLNDTFKGSATTGGGHFGCEMVMDVIYTKLAQHGHQVIQRIGSDETSFKLDPQVDLVFVNGEGSLHHNRRRELIEVAKEAPSILVNTVWEENSPEGLEHFKYISVRESKSQHAMGQKVDIVPDFIFASDLLNKYRGVKATKDTGVTDNVTCQGDGDIIAIQPAESFLGRITQYRRVVCGRFHAAAVCLSLGIPFSAWPSNTHKIAGLLWDAGCFENYYSSKTKALRFCPETVNMFSTTYAQEAVDKIEHLFTRLEEWA